MHDRNTARPGLEYTATPRVADALAAIGRTEDVRFSPNNRRLAIAGFLKHEITVFDIEIAPSATGPCLVLSGGVQLTSPAIQLPHGLDFIDDHTLLVTSRGENVSAFSLPDGTSACSRVERPPTWTWSTGPGSMLSVPGSVAVTAVTPDRAELLICNNAGNTVSSHVTRRSDGEMTESRTLLHRYLDVPDGVAASIDGRWLAVSNHNTHSVLVYDRARPLDRDAEPDAILRRVLYPHGLRFSLDARQLFVADAGAPHVHVFGCGADGWRGLVSPLATARVMSTAEFGRGHHNLQEGGPKGLDLDRTHTVLVVTSEAQPLAFFAPESLVEVAPDPNADVRHELEMMAADIHQRALASDVNRLADYMSGSWSWKLTAPLRRLHSAFSRSRS